MNRNVKVGKAKKGTFKRLLKLIFKENKYKIILVLLFMILATLANVGSMLMIQDVLDEAIKMVDLNSND
ncbi:MAG: hypothetical protein WC907_07270, partial [Acholeplasmataceae bacterium]